MDITVRRLRKEDTEAVSGIICRNFLEVNTKVYALKDMERLAKAYDTNKILDMGKWAHSYVACVNDNIVGCGTISSFWGRVDKSILLTIFVLPELHGKGVGAKIISTLENDEYFLRAKRIEIPSSITACEFYKKFGYDYKNGIKELDDEGHYRLEKFNYK